MGIFIFLPRIVMNNSTRNFTNSSNAQNSSSFKDKLRKLTTGVALAGTLMVGNPSCTSCSHEKNIDQEAKTENVEVKAEGKDTLTDEKTVAFTDVQEANKENDDLEYEKAILEINLELENQQIIKDSLKAVENSKKISEDTKRISEDTKRISEDTKRISENSEKIAENTRRIARNRKNARAEMETLWANVDENVFKSSEKVQDALDEYFQWAKEN